MNFNKNTQQHQKSEMFPIRYSENIDCKEEFQLSMYNMSITYSYSVNNPLVHSPYKKK